MSRCAWKVLLLLVLPSATAGGADRVQMAKALGHLPGVPLSQLSSVRQQAKLAQRMGVSLEEPICGHPDFPDREIAGTDPRTLSDALDLDLDYSRALADMHARMLAAQGSGSWPAGCHPDWPDHHAATYWIDSDSFPEHFHRPVTEQELSGLVRAGVWGVETVSEAREKWDRGTLLETALALMEESFRRVGCLHRRVTGPDGAHNIHIYAERIRGSVIGYAYYNSSSCDDHVRHVIDSGYRPGLHALARLLTHESGHNNNLPHEFRAQNRHHSLMSYSPPPDGLFRGFFPGPDPLPADASLERLASYYGGEPVPVDDEPVPEPPGDPETITAQPGDSVIVILDGRQIRATVDDVTGDDGPGLTDRIRDAVAAVEDYPDKQTHRRALVAIYQATARAISAGDVTFERGAEALVTMRGLLLGSAADRWSAVFKVADDASSSAGLESVAAGLAGDEALSPELLAVIKLIVDLLPEGNLRVIAKLIVAVLEQLDATAAAGPVVEPTGQAVVPGAEVICEEMGFREPPLAVAP